MRTGTGFRLCCLMILLLLTTGCDQQSASSGASNTQGNPCQQASTVVGHILRITQIASGRVRGSVVLDGTKDPHAAFPQVVVTLTDKTQVYTQQQQNCQEVALSTLAQGQHIKVHSTGVAMQSDPPQIEATQIVILPS